jgi:hypothetical protein
MLKMTNTLERLQDHLSTAVRVISGYAYKYQAPTVVCADGSTMSVQASKFHYCTPRSDFGPYTHVEVWYCKGPKQWEEYGYGDGSEPYVFVPIELVAEEIDRRGGMFEPLVNLLLKG